MQAIQTPNTPLAIGPYSQAIRCGQFVFLSGQIPLTPSTNEVVEGGFEKQVIQVFENIKALCEEAGGSLQRVVQLTIYLRDLNQFPILNEVMTRYFLKPYPARSSIGVNALPCGVDIEIDAVMSFEDSQSI
jgi:reactive intermediate/imine deaminase